MNLRRRVAAFVMDRKNLGAELEEVLDASVVLCHKIRELEDENRRLRENLVEMERLYTASCDDVQVLLTGQGPVRGEGQ